MDGDRVPSGDSVHRLILGYSAFGLAIILVILSGVLVSAIKCVVPLSWCLPISAKRSDSISESQSHLQLYPKLRWLFTHVNRFGAPLQGRINPNTCSGRSLLAFILLIVLVFTFVGTHHVYGGNGAEEAYPVKGQYSQFTLLTMTYDARIWNLKMFVKHYSRCSSVREIVVVWNKGQPPVDSDFDSAVPVRIRVEDKNSLNNRFKADPLIKTRAVLEA
ncbi:hypothetical protein J5N97_011222 [Dioscorea zingiberensis]|uniref:Glycosyl transferase 64 domain-containing protein n=1 Tax=Dioscorea zingiberensis TaxID=325984 RepID=A0A9D5HPC7_9LILI|nr:hypothetical protein J5N97_011222 [Dioscorea zingiberensis]